MTTASPTHTRSQVELAEGVRRAAHLRALHHRPASADVEITVRALAADDAGALDRVAQLDSRNAPAGALIGAEADGMLVAAMSVRDGATVSDPFASSSAAAVELLRLRARQLAAVEIRGSRLRRLARGLARRRADGSLAGSPPGGRLLQL